jgi:hypothetical protein
MLIDRKINAKKKRKKHKEKKVYREVVTYGKISQEIIILIMIIQSMKFPKETFHFLNQLNR